MLKKEGAREMEMERKTKEQARDERNGKMEGGMDEGAFILIQSVRK